MKDEIALRVTQLMPELSIDIETLEHNKLFEDELDAMAEFMREDMARSQENIPTLEVWRIRGLII